MFLLLNGWCLIWALDRFWFREPFGTDGIFCKFKFHIQHRESFSDKSFFYAGCWTATTQWSRDRIFKCVEIEVAVILCCILAIGVRTNCLACLAKRGLTGKQHFHSYLNLGDLHGKSWHLRWQKYIFSKCWLVGHSMFRWKQYWKIILQITCLSIGDVREHLAEQKCFFSGRPLPEFLALLPVHFWSIKGVHFLQNANVLNF